MRAYAPGLIGPIGPQGAPGVNSFNTPNTRTIALATAYQATNILKPAVVTANLDSTSTISLGGAVNNEGIIVIGPTAAVAGGTGTAICRYRNTLGGTLVIGLNLSTRSTQPCVFGLPAGWFFAVIQTVGAGLTIDSAFDQQVG